MAITKSKPGKLTTTTLFRSAPLRKLLILMIMTVALVAVYQAPEPAQAATGCNVTEAKYQCTQEGVQALNDCYNFWGDALGDVMCRTSFDDTFYACWKRLGCPNTVYPFPL